MDTLRVAAPVAPPGLETPAARPAPEPRAPALRSPRATASNGPETARPSEESSADAAFTADAARQAAAELESDLHALGLHSLSISFEEEDSRFVVQILDRESGELIRQIPPDDLLEANRRLNELRGLLFDDRS